MIDQSNRTSGNIIGGPAYSPSDAATAASMGYMLDANSQANFARSLGAPVGGGGGGAVGGGGPEAASMGQTLAMTSAAMGAAYSAASAQHTLSHYGRSQQQHAAMLGLGGQPTGPHSMMGDHAAAAAAQLPPYHY